MKFIKILLMLLIIIITSCVEMQPEFFENEFLGANNNGNYEIVEPEIYNGVPTSKREKLLNENFDNNNNLWAIVNTSQAYTSIENSTYIFQNKLSYTQISAINTIINTDRNFEIETNFKISSSLNNNGNSLVWGYDETVEFWFFCFSISSDQNLWIGNFIFETYNPWQNWLALNVKPENEYNKLTVRKINNNYYFFINEQFVISHLFETFYDNNIGFKAEANTTLQIDYLKIDYIN